MQHLILAAALLATLTECVSSSSPSPPGPGPGPTPPTTLAGKFRPVGSAFAVVTATNAQAKAAFRVILIDPTPVPAEE